MGNENLKIVKTDHCIIKYTEQDGKKGFTNGDKVEGVIRFDKDYQSFRFGDGKQKESNDLTTNISVFTKDEVENFLTEKNVKIESTTSEKIALDENGKIKDYKYADTKALLNTLQSEPKAPEKQAPAASKAPENQTPAASKAASTVAQPSKVSANSSDPWQPVLDIFGVTSALNDLRRIADEAWAPSKIESTSNKTEAKSQEEAAKETQAAEERAKAAKERAVKGEQGYTSKIAIETTKLGGMDSWQILAEEKAKKEKEQLEYKDSRIPNSSQPLINVAPVSTPKPDFATYMGSTITTAYPCKKIDKKIADLKNNIENAKKAMQEMSGTEVYEQENYIRCLESDLSLIIQKRSQLFQEATNLKTKIKEEKERIAGVTGSSKDQQALYVRDLEKSLELVERELS